MAFFECFERVIATPDDRDRYYLGDADGKNDPGVNIVAGERAMSGSPHACLVTITRLEEKLPADYKWKGPPKPDPFHSDHDDKDG